MAALCRDCGAVLADAAQACPACAGMRIVRHPELLTLAIAHVDCDAFYASVEKRDRPELAGRPVIVGGGTRGVVSASCYIARMNGVRSAMPMFKALAACPDAVVIPPDFAKYSEAARQIRALMARLTPLVQPLSIDEAVLDLTGTEALHGASPASVLARFARDVEAQVGVTISIGLAPNRLLAKIAAGRDKPRGFAVIGSEARQLLAIKASTAFTEHSMRPYMPHRMSLSNHKSPSTSQGRVASQKCPHRAISERSLREKQSPLLLRLKSKFLTNCSTCKATPPGPVARNSLAC